MRFADVSNQDLLARLDHVVRNERRLVATLLSYLIEVEQRRLHLEIPCTSMHDFCTRKLGFSEDQACRRLAVARHARRYPQLLDAIADGRLNLTAIDRLAPHLKDETVDDVIAAAAHKTRRELDELIARLAPKPDVPDAVVMIPQQAELATASTSSTGAAAKNELRPSAQVMPLAEERYVISFTGDRAMRDKIDLARSRSRHRNPTGDLATIFSAALDLYLAEIEKQTKAKTTRPRKAKASKDPGYVSAETRREVYARDEDRCAYVGPTGERCPARDFLELDHVQPRALGGAGDASNVRLLCRPHNQYAAEHAFGREHIEQKIADARAEANAARPIEGPSATKGAMQNGSLEKAPSAEGILSEAAPAAMPPPDSTAERSDAERPSRVERATIAGPSAPVDPQQRGSVSASTSHGRDARPPREVVRSALIRLGFRAAETDRALEALPITTWSAPLETIVRTALARLT